MKKTHFKIIVPFRNVEKYIKKCIFSIKFQSYKDFQCVLIDDASTDETVERVKTYIKNDDRFFLIENDKNVGALENIFNGINFSQPDNEDVIVNLDGDDWFSNADVLKLLSDYYQEDCWMTYGSHIEYPSGKKSKFCTRPVPTNIIKQNKFRESPWMTSALRTFKYHLWNKIDVQDLKNDDGNFYESAWDLAYMFPMLEMAGNKSKFVKEIVYVYNIHDNNDHNVPEKRLKQLEYEKQIRQNPKYRRIGEEIKTKYNDRYVVEDPTDLLTFSRFDVAAKLLYLRHKSKNVEDAWAKNVYEHHLNVWGGFTEKNPPKNGKKDFYDAFNKIETNIQSNGFDEEVSFIPVTEDGLALNGSHRIASSIFHNKPLVCKVSDYTEGQVNCSYQYFKNKKDVVASGLLTDVADEMALEYIKNKKTTYMMTLYQHCFGKLDEIMKILAKYKVKVVYHKDLILTDNGKLNYILSLYSGEPWIGNLSNGFPGVREQARLSYAAGSKIMAVLVDSEDINNLVAAKKEIRDMIGVGKPSVHTTDTFEETWINATVCFNDQSVKFINSSPFACTKNNKFQSLLRETRSILNNSMVDVDDICVVGSAPLTAYGIRECRDFDILHMSDDVGFSENVSSHNQYERLYPVNKEQIIFNPNNHFYIEGVKFITLENMVEMKSNRGEAKDHRDISSVKEKYGESLFRKNRAANVVVLAAGPPKKDRNRHLELFNGQPLIKRLLDESSAVDARQHVVISKENHELKDWIRENFSKVNIIETEDEKVVSTFKAALSPKGDCILVCGDLINVNKDDINKFINSKFRSATCRYGIPWGNHIQSPVGGILRRADVGDCMSKISEEHKEEFLSEDTHKKALSLFDKFYPNGNQHKKINEYWYNDVGTFISFAFFEKIWSDPKRFSDSDKGSIYFSKKIYEDND